MYLATTENRERTYAAHVDKETGNVVLVAHEGFPPKIGEEVVLEEHFSLAEAEDLERAIRDAREAGEELVRARAGLRKAEENV